MLICIYHSYLYSIIILVVSQYKLKKEKDIFLIIPFTILPFCFLILNLENNTKLTPRDSICRGKRLN